MKKMTSNKALATSNVTHREQIPYLTSHQSERLKVYKDRSHFFKPSKVDNLSTNGSMNHFFAYFGDRVFINDLVSSRPGVAIKNAFIATLQLNLTNNSDSSNIYKHRLTTSPMSLKDEAVLFVEQCYVDKHLMTLDEEND